MQSWKDWWVGWKQDWKDLLAGWKESWSDWWDDLPDGGPLFFILMAILAVFFLLASASMSQ